MNTVDVVYITSALFSKKKQAFDIGLAVKNGIPLNNPANCLHCVLANPLSSGTNAVMRKMNIMAEIPKFYPNPTLQHCAGHTDIKATAKYINKHFFVAWLKNAYL